MGGVGVAADVSIDVVRAEPGRAVVTVAGELDVATSPQLRDCLAATEGDVVVDLAGVTFIDSTALGVLVGAQKSAHNAGFTLSLSGQSEFVRRLLTVAGLDDFFTTADGRP